MRDNPRYASGSSLNSTRKEELLDSLEGYLGDMDDALYLGMKKLSLAEILELTRLVRKRLDELIHPAS